MYALIDRSIARKRCDSTLYLSHLLEFITLYSWQGCPESGDTLSCVVPCDIIDLGRICLFVLIVCEVEAICPIGVQFQEAWSYDTVFQVDSLAANVAFSFQDASGLI